MIAMVERHEIAPGYSISRIIKGGWQLAGGHGRIEHEAAIEDMLRFVDAGITTFDCADIYTGVEQLIGDFLRELRRQRGDSAVEEVQVHTKFVPDLDALATLRRPHIEHTIDRSLRRLGIDALHLVQFHWWDYDIPGYVEAARHLADLQRAGKIRHIGMTNFDTPRLREIVDAGVPIVAHQLQYSALDRRPENGMAEFCGDKGIALLCYGSVAGGFLSDRYLGVAEPAEPLENRSLTKYKLIIDEFGSWDLFQHLLQTLRGIADRHQATIAAVAMRYVLQKPQVAAVIVGSRNASHLPATLAALNLELDAEDLQQIEAITRQSKGPTGDTYSLERVKGARHASIMKYNLNETKKL
jgi:aryl-alcohol dehydrogenase-like predicted oxidoreductase